MADQECSDFWLMLHSAELQLRKIEKEAWQQVAARVAGGCSSRWPGVKKK